MIELARNAHEWHESGLLSAKRTYLRVRRGELVFDICAAPFGKDFFVSWWLAGPAPAFGKLFLLFVAFSLLLPWPFSLVGLALKHPIAGAMVSTGIALLSPIGIFYVVSRQAYPGLEAALLSIPIVGRIYCIFFNPYSYYRRDTTAMFQESVRTSVMEVIDGIRHHQGLRALSPTERAPTLRELARR